GLRGCLLFGAAVVAPARYDSERDVLVLRAYEARELPAAHARQPYVREHGVELPRREEAQRLTTVGRERDFASLALYYVLQKITHVFLVVNDEDSQLPRTVCGDGLCSHGLRRKRRLTNAREPDAERGAATGLRLYLDCALVPPNDAVRDRHPQPHPGLPLRRKKRVEDTGTHLLSHPDASVGDRDFDAHARLPR